MKRFLGSVTIIGAALSSSHAAAVGGWHSGGGILSSVEGNPWFVQPTAGTVTYCLELDKENFGASESIVRASLKRALEYWKTELSEIAKKKQPNSKQEFLVNVGADSFVEAACSSKSDLRFQFGVLSKDQEAKFENPKVHVGAAVRTDYNRETLKGRGFVYISPERGRLALERENVVPNRWNAGDGRLLELTLIHELGHVFGLPHRGRGLMSADFAEDIVGFADKTRPYALSKTTPSVFREYTTIKGQWCMSDGDKSNPRCQKISYKITDPQGQPAVEFLFEVSTTPADVFRVAFKGRGEMFMASWCGSIPMWLPKEQKLFKEFSGREKKIYPFEEDCHQKQFMGDAKDGNGDVVGKFIFETNRDDFSVWIFPAENGAFWPKRKVENTKHPFPMIFRAEYFYMDSAMHEGG
jgi:hypothetical protein